MKFTFSLIVLLLPIILVAQNNLGSWNIVNLNVKLDSKWNLFTESQLRSLSFYDEFHYYEVKAGFSYKIKSNFSVTSGFGSYNTYSEGGNFENPIKKRFLSKNGSLSVKKTSFHAER